MWSIAIFHRNGWVRIITVCFVTINVFVVLLCGVRNRYNGPVYMTVSEEEREWCVLGVFDTHIHTHCTASDQGHLSSAARRLSQNHRRTHGRNQLFHHRHDQNVHEERWVLWMSGVVLMVLFLTCVCVGGGGCVVALLCSDTSQHSSNYSSRRRVGDTSVLRWSRKSCFHYSHSFVNKCTHVVCLT